MAQFVKGQSGNPAGRPKGAKDKKWANLDYWMRLVEREWHVIEPKTRAAIALSAWKTLLSRQKMPTSSDEELHEEAGQSECSNNIDKIEGEADGEF